MAQTRQNWFFLRGLFREAGHFGDFPAAFERSIPHTKVHCIDLPGTGEHRLEPSPSSIEEIAHRVRKKFLTLKERGVPNYIFALSMGGLVALEWALANSTDLDGLVLINTSAKSISPWYRRIRPSALLHLMHVARENDPTKREEVIFNLTSQRPEFKASCVKVWADLSAKRPISRRTGLKQLLAAAQYSPKGLMLRPGLLLLQSAQDQLVHPSCTEALARRFSAPMKIHPSAGHDLPLDDPDWVIKNVAIWIKSL